LQAHDGDDTATTVAKGSTAQMFAALTGVLLILAGIAALAVNHSFASGQGIDAERLLVIDVNGWSALLMLLTGAALLFGARSAGGARYASLGVGVIYLLVTVWSLFTASVAGLLPVGDTTAIVFAAVGVLGVTAGLAPDPRESA
jgi:low temperature requirement protein LtrA